MEQLTLKALRVNAGLSQEQACVNLGINKDTLSRYERRVNFPDIRVINKILELYQVPYEKIKF